MAIYRSIQLTFWTDNKIVDDFTPEDKYFYLYLFTNPQTNLCGCYEVSISTMANQLGYNKDSVERLLERFETFHSVIKYSKKTKELLLLNWSKYNWNGGKQKKCIENEIEYVKNPEFKAILTEIYNARFNEEYTPCKGHTYPLQASVTVTVNNNNSLVSNSNNTKSNKEKDIKNNNKYIYYPNDEKLNQTFLDYMDMRKKIKSPMTDRAVTLAMNSLQKLSGGDNDKAIAILEQSIMNGWKGLFELKGAYTSRTNNQQSQLERILNA